MTSGEINGLKFEWKIMSVDDLENQVEFPCAKQLELYDRLVNGDWKNKCKTKEEKNNMNKVLELYVEREEKRLKEWYKLQEDTEYNNQDIVREFNNAQDEYIKTIEELRDKYNTADGSLIRKTGYESFHVYELSSRIREDIHEKLAVEFDVDMKSLLKKKEEVEALLSLSDDKDYQIEVLTKYEILDKKGMIK